VNGRGFRIATIFGMPIRIHFTWFIIVTLISWTLAKFWFPTQQATAGLSSGWYWAMGVATALLLFLSVLLHELGHSIVAQYHHIPVGGITLFLFGGVSQIIEEPKSARAEAEVTVGGWVVTAAIAGLCFLLYPRLPEGGPASVAIRGVIQHLGFVNLVLLGFNAIPGFPLDGGRLLRAFIWWTPPASRLYLVDHREPA